MMDRPTISLAVPMTIFVLMGVTWLATAVTGHRLFYAFRREYPQVAAERIPYAFESTRFPTTATFFYSSEARELLRTNRRLARLRVQFVVLSLLSLIVPALAFGALFVMTLVLR
jgi:hypothetical protein